MKIRTLTLKNFLSYRLPQTLPMADQGLVLVRGDNRISAALDSNGSGKTGIFNALAYGLFGETLNGLKADSVCCRFADRGAATVVTVELETDEGKVWSVTRGRRPGVFEIDGLSALHPAQSVIDDQLGLGFRTFRNAVIFGQGAFERFAQADQADQLRMLDEIQGLDLRGALEKAKQWRAKADASFNELTQEALSLATETETLQGTIDRLELARGAFAATQRERVKAAETRVQDVLQEIAGLERDAKVCEEAKVKMDRTRKAVQARQQAETRRRSLSHEVSVLDGKLESIETSLEENTQTITALRKQGTCPVCMQKINIERIAQTFGKLRQELVAQQTQARADRTAKLKAVKTIDDTMTKGTTDPVQELGKLTAQAANAASIKGALVAIQARLTTARQGVTAEKTATWDSAPALSAATRSLATVTSRHDEVKQLIKRAVITARVAEYWVDAFGDRGIRSLLIDSVSVYLNDRLRHHLGILAAGEATTTISALTQNKGGGARERLSVSTGWDWGGAERGSGSHGQDRRIDLALFAALQDLAEARAARPFPLRIWDEPGDALDARGQELFVQWVSKEARQRGTGFLVTHNPYLADSVTPDKTWTVVLDGRGSQVVLT